MALVSFLKMDLGMTPNYLENIGGNKCARFIHNGSSQPNGSEISCSSYYGKIVFIHAQMCVRR
jgi:hypothetical protein